MTPLIFVPCLDCNIPYAASFLFELVYDIETKNEARF